MSVSRKPEFPQALVSEDLARLESSVEGALKGKADVVRLALTALLARGHLLVEDVPGVGKTTLASALASAVGGSFRRLQFTSDLMPSDVTGVSIYDAADGSFRFRPGPIFANVVLADEINRATPKTQSAMLEAMNEQRVSVDGVTRPLPDPFFVVATQNPLEQHGTFPLPESQLDRFLLRVDIGYPDAHEEKQILSSHRWDEGLRQQAKAAEATIDTRRLVALQSAAESVHASSTLLDYIVAIVRATRALPDIAIGASPRGSLALLRAAKARALLERREFVLPDDVKAIAPAALGHRLIPVARGAGGAEAGTELVHSVLGNVPVPR